jgi:hypothetical protein
MRVSLKVKGQEEDESPDTLRRNKFRNLLAKYGTAGSGLQKE